MGGENRRILLELKTVLEEVQSEVKREEGRRTELQLQYTKDRCQWDLERAELECRIGQLEAKGKVEISETGDTLRKVREEERRLLADTHTAAMDLRCRLEHREKDWVREKSELLERFDLERKEWESQLRDMQHKIEELHSEVKAHRARGAVEPNADTRSSILRFSMHSGSTASSSLTDPSEAYSGSSSEPLIQHRHSSTDLSQNSTEPHEQYWGVPGESVNQRSSGNYESDELEAINSKELEDILHGCLLKGLKSKPLSLGQEDVLEPLQRFQSSDLTCASDKKKNTMALNAALKEIARVSEELCSYQDVSKKGSGLKRSHTTFPDDIEPNKNNWLETADLDLELNRCCQELNLSLDTQKRISSDNEKSTKTEVEPVKRRDVPPIPFRSTSWYVNSPPATEADPCSPEPVLYRRCRSPCVHRKCNSPSIVQRFEVMLQENEGKILTDSGIVPGPVPRDSKCNISCCQSRWSCDGSRFGSSKSSTYVPIQKCLSEVNIVTAETECGPNQTYAGIAENLKAELQLVDLPHKGVPTEPPDLTSHTTNTNVSRRNETLERKTAEFNRILFQTGIGHQCSETDRVDVHHTFDKTTAVPSLYTEDNPRDVVDILVQRTKYTESAPPKPPQLTSQMKDCDVSLQKRVKSEQSHHSVAQKEDSNTACMPLLTEDVQPSKSSCMRTVQANLDPSPPKLKHQVEKFSNVKSDRRPSETKPKERPTEIKFTHMPNTRSRVLDESPWKPSTLAAYPRPVESRSNYGAIEKILKSYESLAHSQQDKQSQSSPGREEDLIELLNLLELQNQTRSGQGIKPTPHLRTAHKEVQLAAKQSKESTVTAKKSFSRPACPAKRRLPSRWANRSPSTSSTSSPSPSPTTQASVSGPRQLLTYSSFHTETVIM